MKTLLLILALSQVDYADLAASGTDDAVASRPVVSVPELIDDYIASGGKQWFVRGKTVKQHLVEDHGWSHADLAGLNHQQLLWLHGWTHNASEDEEEAFGVVASPSRVGNKCKDAVKSDQIGHKSVVTIYSPATWHCPWCDRMKAQNWSGLPFSVEFKKRDGFGSYPRTEWKSGGKTRYLTGFYRPDQVEWSWERTQ